MSSTVIKFQRPDEIEDQDRLDRAADWLEETAKKIRSGEIKNGIFLTVCNDEDGDEQINTYRMFEERLMVMGAIEMMKSEMGM